MPWVARGVLFRLGGHDEKEQTLNQLLSDIYAFRVPVGLIILAATNRPEILDRRCYGRWPLTGRCSTDPTARSADILVHVRKITLDAGLRLEDVAALTPGFSGADLANLVNEATLVATRRKAERVDFVRLYRCRGAHCGGAGAQKPGAERQGARVGGLSAVRASAALA